MIPRGWIFIDEEENEIGYALPSDYLNAGEAIRKFGKGYAEHFLVYFRDSLGELHSVNSEDKPDDFK